MEARPDDPFELIAIVYSQDELALLTSRLHFEGIWTLAHGGRHIGVDVALTLALGGVRLMVRREEAEAAREVLAAGEPWERTDGVYSGSRPVDLLLALMLVVMTGVPPPARIQSVLVERRRELVAGA